MYYNPALLVDTLNKELSRNDYLHIFIYLQGILQKDTLLCYLQLWFGLLFYCEKEYIYNLFI